MKIFKLHQGICEPPIPLTRENYEKVTQGTQEYSKSSDKGKSYYAVCPSCENPIQIIGLYIDEGGSRYPYGKHYPANFKNLRYIQQNYEYCPLASHLFGINSTGRKEDFTDFEANIYNLVRENYDLAIYVAEKATGIRFSKKTRNRIIEEYVSAKGYMYYHANTYNIPWMLLYFCGAISCYGLLVKKNSKLWKALKDLPDVELEPSSKDGYDIVKNKPGKFLETKINFLSHKATREKEFLTLSIHLPISSERLYPEVLKDIELEIDPEIFLNLIKSRRFSQDEEEKVYVQELMPELR